MSRRPRQLAMELKYRGRGGPREGAGRPRKPGGRVSHDRRPSLSRHHPVHVTLRAADGVPNLRRIQAFRRIADRPLTPGNTIMAMAIGGAAGAGVTSFLNGNSVKQVGASVLI